MSEALREFIEREFPVIPTETRVLTLLAYDAVAEHQRSLDPHAMASELSDEDVVTRLQDPRAFGLFARRVHDARVSREVKIAVAERAFDLIPIPASETAAFRVEERNRATARMVDELGLPEYFGMEALVVRRPR